MPVLTSNAVKAIVLSLVMSTASLAQAPSSSPDNAKTNSGDGGKTTGTKDVDKGQNMILPSAGNAGPSAAPTMVYDCQKRPKECTDPATPADKSGASQQNPIKP